MKLRDFIKKNFWLKVTSLLLAVFLELYFYGPDNSATVSLVVPVEFHNLSKNLMITSPRAAERGLYADVILRGPRPLLEQIQNRNNKFAFDLSGVDSKSHVVFLSPGQLNAPAGVTVEITPERIKLELDKVLRKELGVEVAHAGEVASDYVLSHIQVQPNKIIADGPYFELKGLNTVVTEQIDVTGLTENRSLEVALENPLIHTKYSVNTVQVDIFVNPIESVRDFENVGIKLFVESGKGATVEPSRALVRVTGSEAILKQLDRNQIEIQAEASKLPPGKHEVKISTKLPDGVQLLKVDPEVVTVTVMK